MAKISPRTWVAMGVGISLIAIVVHVLVLSEISRRSRVIDEELSGLAVSLSNQATEVNRAELIQNQFTTLNHIAQLATGDQKKAASDDSIYLLQSYLDRVYLAVNDIPVRDVLKSANEENAEALAYLARLKQAQQSGSTYELDKALKEGEELAKRVDEPKTELGRKMQESAKVADPDKLANKSTQEIINEISPYLKTLNDQFIANYDQKQSRMSELREKKADLTFWASIATYAAIGLQLLGLLLVLAKDVGQRAPERDESADRVKIATAGGSTARLIAKAEPEKRKQYQYNLFDPPEYIRPESPTVTVRPQQRNEARDLLAELEDDLRSALDNVDPAR